MCVFYLIFLSYLPSSWSYVLPHMEVPQFNHSTLKLVLQQDIFVNAFSQLLIASYRPLVLTADAAWRLESGPVLLLSLLGLNMVAWNSLGAIKSDNVGGSRFWQAPPHFKAGLGELTSD